MNDIEAFLDFIRGTYDASDIIARLDRVFPIASWIDWNPTRQRSIGKGYKKRHGRERAKFFESGKHNLKRPK